MHENREISRTSLFERTRPVRKGHKPNSGHARTREVGLCRSTNEPVEQRSASFRGIWGGKGARRAGSSSARKPIFDPTCLVSTNFLHPNAVHRARILQLDLKFIF